MEKVGIILARFQPIHNGHLELIKKAVRENDRVIVFLGSMDKVNTRNPIPWRIRVDLVNEAIKTLEDYNKIRVTPLPDLTDEKDNSHDWGFYLFSNMVKYAPGAHYTMYYSDGFEIITSWFPGFILTEHLDLSLLARGACHGGVSATNVRKFILENDNHLIEMVPKCVYEKRDLIRSYIQAFK